jgi:hypothetical protein
LQGQRRDFFFFFFFHVDAVSRMTLGPTQLSVPWVPATLFRKGCVSGRSLKLTAHLHPVPRLLMSRAIPPLPSTSSWPGTLLSTGTVPRFYNKFHIHGHDFILCDLGSMLAMNCACLNFTTVNPGLHIPLDLVVLTGRREAI